MAATTATFTITRGGTTTTLTRVFSSSTNIMIRLQPDTLVFTPS